MLRYFDRFSFFFFNDTATTEIYTLSLHDALPIWPALRQDRTAHIEGFHLAALAVHPSDRKSTRLNSSHQIISYAVFCLKKKNKGLQNHTSPAHQPEHEQLHPI